MASPISLIGQGIAEADWKKVVQGYNRLSGEKLRPPASSSPENLPAKIREAVEAPLRDAIRRAISSLGEALEGDDEDGGGDAGGGDEEEEEEEEPEGGGPAARPKREKQTVEERAAEARAVARGERQAPDFTHVHAGKPEQDEHSDLGTACRTEPFPVGKFKNEFDVTEYEGKYAKDARTDRKLTKGVRPSPRRPTPRKVSAVCIDCEQTFKIDPLLAPKRLGQANESDSTSSFVCDGCLKTRSPK